MIDAALFPTGRYARETLALQRELIAEGYLPAYNAQGQAADDGWFGPATKRALDQRERDLAEMPPPAKPWWRARRMKGLLLAVGGLAGFFVPALREVDTASLVDLVWSNLDHVEQLITAAGALVALAGSIWSTVGAARAKAPVDPTLVARVGAHELRLPGTGPKRVRQPRRPHPLDAVSPDAERDRGGYWSRERGPFHD